MNQLEQFLINSTGTSPEAWRDKVRVDGFEDYTFFDFKDFFTG